MTEERPYEYSTRAAWVDLLATFASVLLVISAIFQMLQGGAAVANSRQFGESGDHVYGFDLTVWGAVHFVIGALCFVVAIGVLRRTSWGQVTGLLVAGLSALANFAFIPEYPLWSTTVVAFDLLVIWALSTQLAHPGA